MRSIADVAIKILDAEEVGTLLRQLLRTSDRFMWSVAWATSGRHAEALLHASSRLKKLAVGIDFFQTDPDFLERLIPLPGARFVPKLGAVFHPKIYYFEKGADAYAIIGSSNFTVGGTKTNFEASVMLTAARNDDAMIRIRAIVDEAWEAGEPIDADFVRRYRLLHDAAQRRRPPLDTRERVFLASGSRPPRLLDMDWAAYVRAVRNSPHHNVDAGVSLLRKAQQMFASVAEFQELSEPQRRALAGVLQKTAAVAGISGEGWKMFGAMRGIGVFVKAIRLNNSDLSEALGSIPDSGEIEEDHYLAFAEAFTRAFSVAPRQAGVPPASRLLAMKRPDSFLCVDGQNWEALRVDLGGRKALPDWEMYWNGVIEPLRCSRWYNAPRPKGRDAALWDRRMAMLDSVIYSE